MTASNPEAERVQPIADDTRNSAPDAARPLADREVPTRRFDGQPADTNGERAALFEPNLLNDFNARWSEIQTGFVDEPRSAVQRADALVSDVIKRIADSFSHERTQLEQQWDRGDNVSTEDLRVALQRYRSFFSRLLTL